MTDKYMYNKLFHHTTHGTIFENGDEANKLTSFWRHSNFSFFPNHATFSPEIVIGSLTVLYSSVMLSVNKYEIPL